MLKSTFFLFFTLILLYALSSYVFDYLPGNPFDQIFIEQGIQPIEIIKKEKSFIPFIFEDFQKMIQGDFGRSLITEKPLFPIVKDACIVSIQLTFISFFISFFISLLLGLSASQLHSLKLKKNSDVFIHTLNAWAASIPLVITAPLFLYYFSVVIPLFKISGSYFLCALTISLYYSGLWSRMIQQRVSQQLNHDSCRAARGRGLSESRILFKYAFIPSSSTLFGMMGTQMGGLLAGSFIAEFIFNLNGLGTLFVESILSRDYPLMQKALFFTTFITFIGIYIGKLLHQKTDPREFTL